MATVEELLAANLHDVFGNRDAGSRHAAVARVYTEDVVFTDPEETTTGREALEAKAAALLHEAPASFVFAPEGIAYTDTDTGVLAWTFGAPGDPAVRGVDIISVRDGRIAAVRTLIVPAAR